MQGLEPQPVEQPSASLGQTPLASMTPEQMMALIQQLQAEKAAKDAELQEKNTYIGQLEASHSVDQDKWMLKTAIEQIIGGYKEAVKTVEAREKEKDLVIAAQNQENAALKNELHHTADKLKTALVHNEELHEDKAEERREKKVWQLKAEKEIEITQKLAHDLATKDSEINVLKQQLATFQHQLDDLDGSLGDWENINQETSGVSTIGDVSI